jgi:hypothetical protein
MPQGLGIGQDYRVDDVIMGLVRGRAGGTFRRAADAAGQLPDAMAQEI